MKDQQDSILEVRGLTKRFGGLVAVNNLDFDLRRGEIVGLIGPNGSGKSTVMKLIMGLERPDCGSVKLDGAECAGLAPHRIARQRIGLVFQHSRPLERQTVLENILIGLLPDKLWQWSLPRPLQDRARAIAEQVGLGSVIDRYPSSLPFADLRRLELAKAMARDPEILLVDEPFAGLTQSEASVFLRLFQALRAQGKAILLVDHNVKAVASIVDHVIALYLGERIAAGTADQVMRNETVRRVYLGGALEATSRTEKKTGTEGEPLLKIDDLSVFYRKAQALDRVSLRVREREFVSLVGLNGAGKTTLFNSVSGFLPYQGAISWAGQGLKGKSPAAIACNGIVQCPETRELFVEMSVRENLDLGAHHQSRASAKARLDWLFDLFPILAVRQRQMAGTLSGGEQQMLAIGRALMTDPKLLILDEPTLGLAPIILEQLSKALEQLRQTTPITILLGEQNVTFALPHADRIYVIEQGQIKWEGPPERFADEAGDGYL